MYPETTLPITAHIPHAGQVIPSRVGDQFPPGAPGLWQELVALTDWYTDELFGLPGIAISQTPINRLVVDLERFTDDTLEQKAAVGQGVIYTHNTLGERIRRTLSDQERVQLLEHYYRPWHNQLAINLEQQLLRWGHCLLLDCHSFPDQAFAHEDDDGRSRPDICLGISNSNTPVWLLASCQRHFLALGYSVELDFPYAGCLVPERHLGNNQVPAIMLEINRRLYLEPARREAYSDGDLPTRSAGFDGVKNAIWGLMLQLAQELACKTISCFESPG